MPRPAKSTEAPPVGGMTPAELIAWLRKPARWCRDVDAETDGRLNHAADLLERAYPREREDIVRRGQEVLDEIATGTYQGAIPAAEEVFHDPC